RTAVENQRWNGSGESSGPRFRRSRIRVEIGDQWFIRSGSTRATTKRKKPKEGNDQVTNRQLTIEYCAPCNYLPRTLWHVHEIVSVLGSERSRVELIPADKGRYHVTLGDDVLFSKEGEGRFPEPSELIDAAMAAIRQSQ